ncbi:MAG: hypothetical protein P4M11_12040 [Candidatus Pacebacteria bacterium]|nr:hypothetical protein [Candidatus Paceibacterota bacterium]
MADLTKETRFTGFVAARHNETTIRWQKVQIFLLVNSILLGATVSVNVVPDVKIALCIFGLLACAIWWFIQWEAQNAIDYWNTELAKLEPNENGVLGFGFKNPREGFRIAVISTHQLILALVILFFSGWLSLLVYYFVISWK